MFLSKGYLLTNGMTKLLSSNLGPLRFSSAVTYALQKPVEKPPQLDKLYSQINMELRGNEQAVLTSYGQFVGMAAAHLGINLVRNYAVKKPVKERWTLLKCVHIYKKHRVQYETRTYFRHIDVINLTGSTADTFLEYLQRNLPEGVAMKVTKVEIQRLPEAVKASSS
ncbi:28S ribosomal protein S10, mitochondrial [Venturia canescens]|uniref:28S ribosomal protein S10, mitochondrial n=1 Tax=Venturia canescens TaxID=32260 RepID=UPI001C9C6E63|nr:28S ribosomal protein S10, mitochondrial [Venturia canescens]